MTTTQYGIWKKEQDGSEFWLFFDSVEDAVSAEGDGTEVYKFEGKFLGRFKRSVTLQKIKKRKRRRRA